MGLLNGAPTFLGQFGAYFIMSFFYCWLAFVFSENLCVAEELRSDWQESLEGEFCLPWCYPPKSTVVSWKQRALELGCVFFTSQLKWS